jgi:formate hydrogenlyase subunit 3/multisubunit Na+/H+ antiporter MnhD subunit
MIAICFLLSIVFALIGMMCSFYTMNRDRDNESHFWMFVTVASLLLMYYFAKCLQLC